MDTFTCAACRRKFTTSELLQEHLNSHMLTASWREMCLELKPKTRPDWVKNNGVFVKKEVPY